MHNLIEKTLLSVEYLKIPLHLSLENILKKRYLDLQVFTLNNKLIIKVYLVSSKLAFKGVSKVQIVNECLRICKEFKIECEVKVDILVDNDKAMCHPKYFYNLLCKKAERSNIYSALTKLEDLILPQQITGLIIRVKGKKGARKSKKVCILGNPCRHTYSYDKFIKRIYQYQTNMGTYGIKILLLLK